jgi:hypothetical protein
VSTTSDQEVTWTTTSTNWDGFWRHGQWFPIIAGGADDSASDESETDTSKEELDATESDTSDTPEEKSFTQEDVNKLISREVAKAQRGKLDPKELGFDSLRDLKTFFDTAKQQTEEAKSDAEKAIEQARKEAAKQAREEVLVQANERIIKAEFLVAAKEHGVRYTSDALALARNLDLWKEVDITDDGVVHGLDDDFFESLKEAKPFLFEAPEPKTPDIGAGRRGGASNQDKQAELAQKFPALRGLVP